MAWPNYRVIRFLVLVWMVLAAAPALAHEETSLRVVVVGDTGVGERSDQRGFDMLEEAMRGQRADVILHLGDFVYQPKLFPRKCPDRYIDKIRKTLAEPYPVRVFVAGDNDLPPNPGKPKASGCWERIAPLATPFDDLKTEGPRPGPHEGTMQVGPVLFAVADNFDWENPAGWLAPRVEQARREHRWVIYAQHVPPLTTAWYHPPSEEFILDVMPLKPDVVFSGNQHSYERFFPMPALTVDEGLKLTRESRYPASAGTTYIVSGGGGAFIKPFADQQEEDKRTAPDNVRAALAMRGLMLHFLTLDVTAHAIRGQVHRVCPAPKMRADSRWHPSHPMWQDIVLDCDGKPPGVTVVDRFEIRREDGPGAAAGR